jgi:hypothetical protein
VRRSGNRSQRADSQLDLGRQGCGFALDVAVEPVAVLAVDSDSHPSIGALVNLIIPLRPAGDQPQSQLDPMPEPAWRSDVEIEDTVVRTCGRVKMRFAPQLDSLLPTSVAGRRRSA